MWRLRRGVGQAHLEQGLAAGGHVDVVEVEEVADARVVPESDEQNGLDRDVGCIYGCGCGIFSVKAGSGFSPNARRAAASC